MRRCVSCNHGKQTWWQRLKMWRKSWRCYQLAYPGSNESNRYTKTRHRKMTKWPMLRCLLLHQPSIFKSKFRTFTIRRGRELVDAILLLSFDRLDWSVYFERISPKFTFVLVNCSTPVCRTCSGIPTCKIVQLFMEHGRQWSRRKNHGNRVQRYGGTSTGVLVTLVGLRAQTRKKSARRPSAPRPTALYCTTTGSPTVEQQQSIHNNS